MTVSAEERSRNIKEALACILHALADRAIDETFFDPGAETFSNLLRTTWDELETQGWLEYVEVAESYRFTGTGLLGALQTTGKLSDGRFTGKSGWCSRP